jgi:hypothetical protein
MTHERLQLGRADSARYFAPVAFCAYLALICIALTITSAFLPRLPNAAALAAVGALGFALSAALGAAFLHVQLRELRYLSVPTQFDSLANFDAVTRLAQRLGWRITGEQPGWHLHARTSDTMLQQCEIVAVQFRDQEVRVASICAPDVGYSIVGRRRCQQHREQVLGAVLRQPPE